MVTKFKKRFNIIFTVSSTILLISVSIFESVDGSGAFVEERVCAALYSNDDLKGDPFKLNDFDQTVNIGKDYRSSIDGWGDTNSILVEDNCTLNICNDTYFQGECKSLHEGYHNSSQLVSSIQSANCTCSRNCKCENVQIPMNDRTCGRAYVGGDCNSCDSEYFQLHIHEYVQWFSSEYRSAHIRAFQIRKGCKLLLFKHYTSPPTREIRKETTILQKSDCDQERQYKCICEDANFTTPDRPSNYPILVDLPASGVDLTNLLENESYLISHPGLWAAKTSLENGRSSRNAYILAIGANDPDIFLGGGNVKTDTIGELYKSVNLDKMGISNAQIRLVYADIPSVQSGKSGLSKWLTMLEDYLNAHEELQNVIPNAVIVFHDNISDPTIGDEGSSFQAKLHVLDYFGGRILDSNYSNVAFVVGGITEDMRNPGEYLDQFESVIESRERQFPKPTVVLPARRFDHKVNGYMQMPNLEYYPKNLQDRLILACEKGGDPLGKAIFEAGFPEEKEMKVVRRKNVTLNMISITTATERSDEYDYKYAFTFDPWDFASTSEPLPSTTERITERKAYHFSTSVPTISPPKLSEQDKNVIQDRILHLESRVNAIEAESKRDKEMIRNHIERNNERLEVRVTNLMNMLAEEQQNRHKLEEEIQNKVGALNETIGEVGWM